jgi:hypothetical protein
MASVERSACAQTMTLLLILFVVLILRPSLLDADVLYFKEVHLVYFSIELMMYYSGSFRTSVKASPLTLP